MRTNINRQTSFDLLGNRQGRIVVAANDRVRSVAVAQPVSGQLFTALVGYQAALQARHETGSYRRSRRDGNSDYHAGFHYAWAAVAVLAYAERYAAPCGRQGQFLVARQAN